MVTLMVGTFIFGYILIAIEHKIQINKAAVAVTLGMLLWVMYIYAGNSLIMGVNSDAFKQFLSVNPEYASLPIGKQCIKFISESQIIHYLGEQVQIIFYLIGAMTIVELVDVHGGFTCITDRIKTRNKRKLLWIISFFTFFMSAILDNLTTAILITMLLRKLINVKKERWIFCGMVILAANSGGAWTPTGDVTTIMLWINENVTTGALITQLFLPSLVSMLVPLVILTFFLDGSDAEESAMHDKSSTSYITPAERTTIFILGISGLIFIPIFKAITGLPPFIGVMLALGAIWIFMEILYDRRTDIPRAQQHRIGDVFARIDLSTILFFLGILMAVSALQTVGVLSDVSKFLDEEVHNIYVINTIIGMLSSIVDNVPLVAGAMGMYDIPTQAQVLASAEPAYLAHYAQDGAFWQLLAYCAGVGGSILIIGSAAGVVVMGIEKITFSWYLKYISLLALIGYFAGIAAYIFQSAIISAF